MIFGVVLPNFVGLGHREPMVRIAQTAEELGFASLWTSDQVLMPAALFDPYGDNLECLTTLAFLACCTHRIRLGTSILILPLRDRVIVAKQVATIHELSGGRFTLGVGVGWSEAEFQCLGVDFDTRSQLTDQHLDVIRTLWGSRRTGRSRCHGRNPLARGPRR